MSLIFSMPVPVALDDDGNPIPGALLYFYESGTTTPKPVYQDIDLNDAHPNPVVANAYGIFPVIRLDTSAGYYTVTLKDANLVQRWSVDNVDNPFDISSVSEEAVTQHEAALTILETQITDGALLARVAANETVAGNWNFTGTVKKGGVDLGFLGLPVNASNNPTVSWRGLCNAITAGITLPAGTFAAGDAFGIYNPTSSALTINRGTGLTMYYAGADAATLSLGAHQTTMVWYYTNSVCVIK
jgi:hypothetical protein